LSIVSWFPHLFWLLVVSVFLLWRLHTVVFLRQTEGEAGSGVPTFYWNVVGDFFRAVKRARTERLPIPIGIRFHGLSILLLVALIVGNSIHKVS
jgi:hypothetical protein